MSSFTDLARRPGNLELISLTVNLNAVEKKETLQSAVQCCGFSTWTELTSACGLAYDHEPNAAQSERVVTIVVTDSWQKFRFEC